MGQAGSARRRGGRWVRRRELVRWRLARRALELRVLVRLVPVRRVLVQQARAPRLLAQLVLVRWELVQPEPV